MKNIDWTIENNYIIGKINNNQNLKNNKIAAFDLDHTLIKPTGNKKFSDTDSDWEVYDKRLKDKLAKLVKEGYQLVIISNQKGVSSGKVGIDTLKSKMNKIVNYFGLDFVILCSFEDDLYRKPRTALWDKFVNGDISESFYCGDAAGFKGDFSDTDLKFALNVGIKFIYRDEFINNIKIKVPEIDYPVKFDTLINKDKDNIFVKSGKQEVIINIGLPGSGKSQYAKQYILPENYIHINQDTLKTKAKCLKVFESSLISGKSIVVDNVNINKEQRKVYLDLAKKYNVQCRCIHFTTSREICVHNAYYRNFISDGTVKPIPTIAFNIINKKYEEPELSEGFYKIEKIPFSINKLDKQYKLYTMFFY